MNNLVIHVENILRTFIFYFFFKDISGERIWMELKKICIGRLGGAVLTTMLKQCNLASLLGLPENADTAHLCNLHRRYYPNIEAMTLLSSLFTEMEQIEIFHKRLFIF